MTATTHSVLDSLKRKRSNPSTPQRPTSLNISTSFSKLIPGESSDVASPRTEVSERLVELALDGDRQKVRRLSHLKGSPELENEKSTMEKTRKRVKYALGDAEIPETPQAPALRFHTGDAPLLPVSPVRNDALCPAVEKSLLANTSPSVNRLWDTKSKGLQQTHTSHGNHTTLDTPTDPDRAALTWRDNEITGFDPEDKDDDGRGLDGVGFKQTAARIDARTQKKKQQLMDYRNRESKEARAKRSKRRKAASAMDEERERSTRVRFSGGDNELVTT